LPSASRRMTTKRATCPASASTRPRPFTEHYKKE
jgi:hypothetical protein